MKKNVILLGKGSLAIKIAEWFKNNHNLILIVPDIPEPSWTESFSDWAKSSNVEIVKSGDYRDVSSSIKIDLAMSVFMVK